MVVLFVGRLKLIENIDLARHLATPVAPKNYKDPAKIAAYVAKEKEEQLRLAATTPLLSYVSNAAISEPALTHEYEASTFETSTDIASSMLEVLSRASLIVGYAAKKLCRALALHAASIGVPNAEDIWKMQQVQKVDIFDEFTYKSERMYDTDTFASLVIGEPVVVDVESLDSSLSVLAELCKRLGIVA